MPVVVPWAPYGFPNFIAGSFFLEIAEPRVLGEDSNEGDQVVDAELFERLKDLIQCQICASIYRQPQCVRTCLHKFCEECIERYNKQM